MSDAGRVLPPAGAGAAAATAVTAQTSRAAPPIGSERAAAVALVGATLLWGATFVAIRATVRSVDPRTLVFGRFACAALLLLPVLIVRRRALHRRLLLGGALSALCAAGGYVFQAIGLTDTSAGSSAFITSLGNGLSVPIAWLAFRQVPGRAVGQGLLVALLGSALLAEPGAALRGDAWTLVGALLFGAQIVVLMRVAPDCDPLALAAVQMLGMALVCAPFAHGVAATWRTLAALPRADLWRFAYLAAPAGIAAPLLQIVAQRRLSAARTTLLLGLEPVFALVFALAVGRERFALHWYAGAALILAGVTWVELRPSQRTSTA